MPSIKNKKQQKKAKIENPLNKKFSVFYPYKSIGYVATEVSPCIQNRGQAFFLTSPVGHSFHIYNVKHHL